MLQICGLHASIEGQGKEILRGLDLHVLPGEIHVVMGPNGAGKSTLTRLLAGDPHYEVTAGEVLFQDRNLLEMEPEERARAGLFIGFQYPVEIPGVTNFLLLHKAKNARLQALGLPLLSEGEFAVLLEGCMREMGMSPEFAQRGVNEGFSGGEKKRNEIVQMALLEPECAVLDETDSGLDIDALRIVAEGVHRHMRGQAGRSLLLITHYQRLLNYVRPDRVHIMVEGAIVRSGGPELAQELEALGYEALLVESRGT